MAGTDIPDVPYAAVGEDDAILRTILEPLVEAAKESVGGNAGIIRVDGRAPFLIGRLVVMDGQPMQVEHAVVPGPLLCCLIDFPYADLGGLERQIETMRKRHHFTFARPELGDVALALVDQTAGQKNGNDDNRDRRGNGQAQVGAVFRQLVPATGRCRREFPHAAGQDKLAHGRRRPKNAVTAEEGILDALWLRHVSDREMHVDMAMITGRFRCFNTVLKQAGGAIESLFVKDRLDITPALHAPLDLGEDRQEKLKAVAPARQANGADHHGLDGGRSPLHGTPRRTELVEVGTDEPLLAFAGKRDAHYAAGSGRRPHHLRVLQQQLGRHDREIVRGHLGMNADAVGEPVEGGNIGVDLRLEAIGDEVQLILDVDPQIASEVFKVLALIDVAAAEHNDAGDRSRYQ